MIDNIIHSQGSFSHILYKSYIVTHAITQCIAFELCLGRTISSMLELNKRGEGGGCNKDVKCHSMHFLKKK